MSDLLEIVAFYSLIIVAPVLFLGYASVKLRGLRERGRCAGCGYDLSHLRTTICPECGLDRCASDGPSPRRRASLWAVVAIVSGLVAAYGIVHFAGFAVGLAQRRNGGFSRDVMPPQILVRFETASGEILEQSGQRIVVRAGTILLPVVQALDDRDPSPLIEVAVFQKSFAPGEPIDVPSGNGYATLDVLATDSARNQTSRHFDLIWRP